MPNGKRFTTHGAKISSPGIHIQSKSITSSSTLPAIPTMPSKAVSSGTHRLSTGAKVGIGVSVGMGGLALLFIIGFLLLWWRQPSSREVTGVIEASEPGSVQILDNGFCQKTRLPP
ncbi:unnamed protein product [Penicillium roqueforti FM164]|uniref:Uncharacterized protein n=1 Tax=Penicillium roqueforti (strain FM164) TaxID=1365484 RepID=W6R9K6_PENRF|nr:unnamed protein product [Penicillium roqueforti FM164]